MNLKDRLRAMAEKKLQPIIESRKQEIYYYVMDVLKEEYTSAKLMSQWKSIARRLSDKELANPVEIPANSKIINGELIINLRDKRVSRTFRALELYGEAPFQKVKNRLGALGYFALKTIK